MDGATLMKYYKDPDGNVYAYENAAEKNDFGPTGLTAMSAEEVAAQLAPKPAPPPTTVSMRQARLALLAAGLLQSVEASISALPEPQQTAARIEWDYSSEVYRDKPFVLMLAAALDLTGEQIDNLFITAANL